MRRGIGISERPDVISKVSVAYKGIRGGQRILLPDARQRVPLTAVWQIFTAYPILIVRRRVPPIAADHRSRIGKEIGRLSLNTPYRVMVL
jgi:hypothetical protein